MQKFEEYKKSLEDLFQEISFFYSGDVIKSEERTFMCRLNHSSISTQTIIEVWKDVYQKSFDNMIEKSEEIIIHRNNFTDVYDVIDQLKFTPKIMFFSSNSYLNLNLSSSSIKPPLNFKSSDDKFLPDYFFRKFKLMSSGLDISSYISPLINDSVDDCTFYLVDSAIQSSVWIIQNMTYVINKGFSSNEHIVKYPIYECDFKSVRVKVLNTQKIREDKISKILNEN